MANQLWKMEVIMVKTYSDAGVNKETGYHHVERIKEAVNKTHNVNVLSHLGGFSGLYELDCYEGLHPVLVSGSDGVGTKVKLAYEMGIHDSIGIDCVAMCVNDILCQGAKPLFFLDYLATGSLDPDISVAVVEGVVKGCQEANMALIGGETAEMPGVYHGSEYDLAGFAVGIVNKEDIITGNDISKGDVLIGIESSGIHSNGFSLVRAIVSDLSLNQKFGESEKTLGQVLLEPTRIYVSEILNLREHVSIKGMAHITGGGLYENLPRILPRNVSASVQTKNIPHQEIFSFLQNHGSINIEEMYNTFNMGVGFVVVIAEEDTDRTLELLGDSAFILGTIEDGNGNICLK